MLGTERPRPAVLAGMIGHRYGDRMPQIDVVEETYVSAAPAAVRHRFRQPDVPAALWPDLAVTVTADRGPEGRHYAVAGALAGTAELWLEEFGDGVLVHAYLRADPPGAAWPAGRAARVRRRWQRGMKAVMWRLKDELEAGRPPGEPATPAYAAGG